MFKTLISCWGRLPCISRKKKDSRKNTSIQENALNSSDGKANEIKASSKEKCLKDKNALSKISVNPLSDDGGCFVNPVFCEEQEETSKNPFLKINEKVVLIETSEGVLPYSSTNPFIYDFFGVDELCFINLVKDPILGLTQCPKDYETMTEEWVEHHRQFHLQPMRSFTA